MYFVVAIPVLLLLLLLLDSRRKYRSLFPGQCNTTRYDANPPNAHAICTCTRAHIHAQGGGSEANPGIVQIATRDLFRLIQEKTDRMFLMRVSYLEIYQEEIRDLLNLANTNMQVRCVLCLWLVSIDRASQLQVVKEKTSVLERGNWRILRVRAYNCLFRWLDGTNCANRLVEEKAS